MNSVRNVEIAVMNPFKICIQTIYKMVSPKSFSKNKIIGGLKEKGAKY